MEDKVLIDEVLKRANQIYTLQSELKNCRNELCYQCGRYKEAHLGACDDCRYRKGGEWEEGLDNEP